MVHSLNKFSSDKKFYGNNKKNIIWYDFFGFIDIEQIQGRSGFYQQRNITLNHNGSNQYSSNTNWHRQSVDLNTQHQGI